MGRGKEERVAGYNTETLSFIHSKMSSESRKQRKMQYIFNYKFIKTAHEVAISLQSLSSVFVFTFTTELII